MLSWFQPLLPKEDDFFRLFNAHAAALTRGVEAMRRIWDGGDDVPEWCARIVTVWFITLPAAAAIVSLLGACS